MWGAVGGALGGGFGSLFNGVGTLYSMAGKAIGSIPQILGQSGIAMGTYIAQSYANGENPTFIGIIASLFGGSAGGALSNTIFTTQFIINMLSEGLNTAITGLKQILSNLFKYDSKNNFFW